MYMYLYLVAGPTPPTRVLTPMRRHMCSPSGGRELVASMERSAPRGSLSPSPVHILPLKRCKMAEYCRVMNCTSMMYIAPGQASCI